MAIPTLLATLFPVVDGKLLQVGDLVKDFDFSKIDVKQESSRNDYLRCDLAPSFGELSSETVQEIDDELKVMIFSLTKQLANLPPGERTWDHIVSLCAQSPLLEALDDRVWRSDNFIQETDFKTDGSPDASMVKEVNDWFKKLISDEDILDDTKLNIEIIDCIATQFGSIVDDFVSFSNKKEKHEQTMVDIQVVRYPDMYNPYFKDDHNGIRGDFNMHRYRPRSSVIGSLMAHAKQEAAKGAENLFDF